MIPLGLDRGGSLLVGRVEGSRGMWVCAKRECVEKIEEQPKLVARAIRSRPPDTRGLTKLVRQNLHDQICDQLRQSWRAGLIVEGSRRVMNCMDEELIFILMADDAGKQIRQRVDKNNSAISSLVIPMSMAEIGQLLGRGPRTVLGLRPGRKTQSLIETLRGWYSLG